MNLPTPSSPTFFTPLSEDAHIACNPLEQLERNPWHCVTGQGHWDFDSLSADFRCQAFHSSSEYLYSKDEPTGIFNKLLCFRITDQVFAEISHRIVDIGKLVIWAPTQQLARRHFQELHIKYGRPNQKFKLQKPSLFVLSSQLGQVETEKVYRLKNLLRTNKDVTLHYGDEFLDWCRGYLRDLRTKESGVSIFSGPPGTGKTNFIRYLVHKLKRTHVFYYVPVSHSSMISSPDMVHFWIRQNLHMPNQHKVIILEDAEPLLLERGGENWRQLSNLLNVSDGLLGDLLRVQIICTMNTGMTEIDPALMRSGRLVAHHHFGRLSPSAAKQIAHRRGLSIPEQEDYSLAEIYHAPVAGFDSKQKARLGF